MMMRKRKIVVAMSGGVDSSVAAGLLVEQGYDVQGVSLRMWEPESLGARNCSDHRGAGAVAQILGIHHTLLDLRAAFAAEVVRPFVQAYLRGRTPNPCVACNRDFKLGALLDWAVREGADYVATGHYARIVHDHKRERSYLYRSADRAKDQSYFLFALSQQQLAATLFPLGEMQKDDVRQQAKRMGLPVADKPESQDICFGDYRALIKSHAYGQEAQAGEIVDGTGKVLGHHQGIHAFTVGQRRGLGVSAAYPLYVLDIEEQSQRVTVGRKDQLACGGLIAENVNWLETSSAEEVSVEVQVRHRSRAVGCVVRRLGGKKWEVRFRESLSSVTPGQAAVFYRGDQLVGGGWISEAIRE